MKKLHPKTRASLSAGVIASAVVMILGYFGIVVPSDVVAAVVTVVVFAASYLAPGWVTE